DLICDGRLIDFKSFKRPKLSTEYLRQLLGYFLLDYNDTFSIRECSFYFPRHDHWITLDINALLAGKDQVTLRNDFKIEMKALRKDRESYLRR
ncbi:MAG TPA: hypothetical protein VIJ49_08295, partial [Aestuariivirga sp.]